MKYCYHVVLLNETMFQSGTVGFKSSNHKRYHQKERRLTSLSLMKRCLKKSVLQNIFGHGLLLRLKAKGYLDSIHQKSEI